MQRIINAASSVFTFGVYDADGSLRVRLSDGTPKGVYAPDGAIRVTVADSSSRGVYAPDGSLYITDTLSISYNGPILVNSLTGISGAFSNSFDFSDANNSFYLVLLGDI